MIVQKNRGHLSPTFYNGFERFKMSTRFVDDSEKYIDCALDSSKFFDHLDIFTVFEVCRMDSPGQIQFGGICRRLSINVCPIYISADHIDFDRVY